MNEMTLSSRHRIRNSSRGGLGVLSSWKKSKNPRKTRIGRTSPTHPPIQFNMYTKKKRKKTEKKTKLKKESELGLDPPTHFRVFLGFLDFFNLTKPLTSNQGIYSLI